MIYWPVNVILNVMLLSYLVDEKVTRIGSVHAVVLFSLYVVTCRTGQISKLLPDALTVMRLHWSFLFSQYMHEKPLFIGNSKLFISNSTEAPTDIPSSLNVQFSSLLWLMFGFIIVALSRTFTSVSLHMTNGSTKYTLIVSSMVKDWAQAINYAWH